MAKPTTGGGTGGGTTSTVATITGTDFNDFFSPSGSYYFNGNGKKVGLTKTSTGSDSVSGLLGNDTIFAGGGSDTLMGGDGGDALYGEAGNDSIHGGNGNDSLIGGLDNDTIDGGGGVDTLFYDYTSNAVTVDLALGTGSAGAGDADKISAVENLVGGSGDDQLSGDAQANVIRGGSGGDTLSGAAGDDTLSGENGRDQVRGGDGNDSLTGDNGADNSTDNGDGLYGEAGNDTLSGGNGGDRLEGGDGDDRLVGDNGDDTLVGGAGNDTFEGGDGNDRIVFSGNLSGYTLTVSGGSVTVSSAADGTDVVRGGTESLVFQDQTVGFNGTALARKPVLTSAATASVAENTTAAYTVTATDADPGTTLTYSITGGADAAKFDINSSTGAVTFRTAPNYEVPTDAGANNVYDITVQVSDGALTASQAVAITVTDANDAPVFTSGATASTAENVATTTAVYTAAASDEDGNTVTYSISGGDDAALFDIDSATGAVTFKASPNFESPTDTGANNVYNIEVQASDGTTTGTKAVAITVTNANEAPAFTSGTTASTAENVATTTAVYTAAASDPDAGASLSYSISGGADSALFDINSSTGAVTFKTSPNYESPTDTGANNVYDITVQVSDGTLTATQNVAITVTDANEAPAFTSGTTASTAENVATTTAVYTAAASDPDAGATVSYSISGGADSALFDIDSATGAVTFKASPNFESPADTGANNVYDIEVQASDGTLSATQSVAISVTNANEAPAFTSGATASTAENVATTTAVYTAAASDPDASTTLSYSISGGADSALFDINSSTGAVTFKTSPNYESPTDTGANNVYDIEVQVSDGTLTATQSVAITVTDANDAPVFTSGATASTAENVAITTAVYTAATSDADAGATVTYSISGGADSALFDIDSATGAVTFKASPNYESPTDTGANNVYDIEVQASDGTASTTQAVAITVTNANDAPAFTSGGTASTAENVATTTAVYTAAASDPDAGASLSYSISGGADSALFDINSSTGAVTFKTSPNYESPTDTGANNVYDITVQVSDGTLTATQNVAITVTDANEAPAFTSGTTASTAENVATTTAVYTAAASDPDAGASLSYSISGGADSALFDIDSATGAVTFKASPNFESPTDTGANNVYDIEVQVSDGTLSATQSVAISVTNANEAPSVTSGATATVAENVATTTAVYTAAGSDPDASTTLSWSISGGADAAKFNIDSSTGAVTFKASPNFESPTDAGANNVYDITVQASDGSLTATKDVAISVTSVLESNEVWRSTGGTFQAQYSSIQAAVTAASAGDVLTVGSGNYLENVTVGKGVTITSANGAASTNVYSVRVNALGDGENFTLNGFTLNRDAGGQAVVYNGAFGDTATVGLTFSNLSISDYNTNGIAVYGGGANLTTTLSGVTLTGNGDNTGSGGKGDLLFYNYGGATSLTNVTVTGDGTANHGISFTGHAGDYSQLTTVVDQPMGSLSFSNVTVSGAYQKTFVFIQAYNDLENANFTGLTLGSASGSAAGWTGLYIDVAAGVTTDHFTAASDGVTDISLAGLNILGGTFGYGVQNLVNGGYGADSYTGSSGNDVFQGLFGDDVINGGDGIDAASYLGYKNAVAPYPAEYTYSSTSVVDNFASPYNEGTDTLTNVEGLVFQNYGQATPTQYLFGA